MINFSELNITLKTPGLIGQKIEVADVLGTPIEVHKFIVKPSNFVKPGKERGECLHLQIKHENKDRVIFIGSRNLIEQINQVQEGQFPFKTTIIKQGKGLYFS